MLGLANNIVELTVGLLVIKPNTGVELILAIILS